MSEGELWCNTVGYALSAPKWLFLARNTPEGPAREVSLCRLNGGEVWRGRWSAPVFSENAGVWLQSVEFTDWRGIGEYGVCADGAELGKIRVAEDPWRELNSALIKAYYYQRASMALEERFAGPWERPAGHPDDHVIVHPSAASPERVAGTVISCPGGWYDAGDYNKYTVNAAITVWTLLAIAEHFPQTGLGLSLNIPESGGGLPDLLEEVLWNLEWMSSMQDLDGGVYHKLTNLRFDPMRMPHECVEPRFVVGKSVTAAFSFAAAMAQAARVYRRWLPEKSARWLEQAIRAYRWALRNPDRRYRQPEDVRTGRYEDDQAQDDWFWAAMELWVSTEDHDFRRDAPALGEMHYSVPNWCRVATLGLVTAAWHAREESAVKNLLMLAEHLRRRQCLNGERVAMSPEDFCWGSNAEAANQGLIFLVARLLTGQQDWVEAALHQMDYLLGRNPLRRSFVTGFGNNPPLHPHHRPSAADGVVDPVPGLLVGGPNPGRQDAHECPDYPAWPRALAYLDHARSFATNEVAINWNAPAAYLVSGLRWALTSVVEV